MKTMNRNLWASHGGGRKLKMASAPAATEIVIVRT